ncbi:sugar ABC transporter substrate-binding protein [Kitasatospora viridis]|uniref:Simple sugar transport system substrate-binding protein/ribose transport system substrate-binding protein n=1 Tax=Kitasatospora viridis TaxID=281105 RepID=A0A561S9A0_9ACTN|nr:sugar ABC transporter substrate-binding protein [Kitasatospora viridis]TWF71449.1 simple sugar transport system substrate-binding protein/ribose transport system substrate-binding protein [Kitasatospora viridis]
MKRRTAPPAAVSATILLLTGSLAACSTSPAPTPAGAAAAIGIDNPRTDTAFWKAYAQYLAHDAADQHLSVLPPTESDGDDAKFTANVTALATHGPKAIVMAPQDTVNTGAVLDDLLARHIDAVSVDTVPETGYVYMVVRADNRALGTQACEFLGKRLGGTGKVAELQGALASINGYDRSQAFASCMKNEFPRIQLIELATDWTGAVASAKLRSALAGNPDLNGVYLQSGGAFLQPTLALLQQQGLLKPAGQPGHITIAANDGTPQELDAIRKGQIDATVSQPADLYAKYALYYAEAAAQDKTFQPGPTDHDSTVIQLPNGLEDQLPSSLVTKDNVDDKALWGNATGA